MDGEWQFRVFVTPTGIPEVQGWIDGLDVAARDELEDILDYLRSSHPADWKRPYSAPMGSGLHEIRFSSGNVQYRILGAFGPNRWQFTMLVGATKTHGKGKKRQKYDPKDAVKTARARKNELDRNQARTAEIDL